MKKIALLGSTGSIGRQVLEVVDRYPEEYQIISLCCNSSGKLLCEQINKYKPLVAGLTNPESAAEISSLQNGTTLYTGENALLHCILPDADIVFIAVVGFCGFKAVVSAAKMGKTIALANKESLISGGEIIMPLIKAHKATLIPVDSEHSAIWQCLNENREKPFKKILLTASGGALRDCPIEKLPFVTAKDALKHPNWKMGAKITIDCATMFNKGLEVMEAKWLFNCDFDKIEVLIHPQSIIHSMVEYADNAVIAQLGSPTMDIPIQYALTYPDRKKTAAEELDFFGLNLNFFKPDIKRYPCFKLALDAAKEGGVIPCAISSANEEAVKLFLSGKIKYTNIAKYLSSAAEKAEKLPVTYDNLTYTDLRARQEVLRAFKENKFD